MNHFALRYRHFAALFVFLALIGAHHFADEATTHAQSSDPPNDIFLPFVSQGADTPIVPPTGPTIRIQRLSESDSTIEALGQPIQVGIERLGDLIDVEVKFAIAGAENDALTSVNSDELAITDESGAALTDSVIIPAQRSMVTITVQALVDDLAEVPESGFFQIQPSGAYQTDASAAQVPFFARDDTAQLTDESKLFVATLAAQNGAKTNATGIATVRLSNDNQNGSVNVSFSGLTSPQIAAHIHEATTDNIIFSIPLGQATNLDWTVEAADPLLTNQATLDALLTGQLYINVHSREFPDGEIKATLTPVNGSIEMPTPPSPDPIETLTDTELQQDIARFLTQATFGPTPETVVDMEARIAAKDGDRVAAYSEWLDEQMAIQSPSLLEYYRAFRPMYRETDLEGETKFGYLKHGLTEGWFTSAVYSKAQLRDRVGFALSEIFVISIEDASLRNFAEGPAHYYDMLRTNAFGPYQELLTGISTHPSMGWYLSHFQNQAEQLDELGEVITSPDENYAREVMQLFSIGLVELHPDGSLKLGSDGLPIRTYDQTDITELARVFTGWGMSVYNPDGGETDVIEPNERFTFSRHPGLMPYHPYWSVPMKMFTDNGREPEHSRYVLYHDSGEKTVLDTIIPAGLSGEDDLTTVMSLLSNHPNTAPFIAYRLIQRLVTSNPSAGYLYRVSTAFTESEGNLGEVVKAILLDPEARNLSFQQWQGYGKKKEPLVHFTAMLRLIEAKSTAAESHPLDKLTDYGFPLSEMSHYDPGVNQLFLDTNAMQNPKLGFEQTPLRAPTVFNWFSPDYAPPGQVSSAGLVAPELQLATENQVISYYNTFYRLLISDGLSAGRPQALLDKAPITYDLPQWLIDAYMSEMDTNSDGQMTGADNAFDDPTAVRSAAAALVKQLDLYLCAGYLQAASADNLAAGGPTTDPYSILIDGLVQTMDNLDHKSAEDAIEARDERIQEALFLVGTAPDCLIQQ